MATLKQITTEAKKIHKAHPNKKWTDCIKEASSKLPKKMSGVKVTVKTGKAKRKKVETVRVSGVRKGKVVEGVKPTTRLKRGEVILGAIGKLEKRYKKTKDRDLKKLLVADINAKHDQLDALIKSYKKLK